MTIKKFKPFLFIAVSILIFAISYISFLRVFYPTKYKDIVIKYCEKYEVDPLLVFSIIKNESGFEKDAVSSVGARGLMQITEETFNWIKTKLDPESGLTFEDMFNPETNVKYGTFLLKLALDEFDDDSAIYSAYHAGFNITKIWLCDERFSSDGVILHKVPYEDTEIYIKNVKKTLKIYNKLYGGKI